MRNDTRMRETGGGARKREKGGKVGTREGERGGTSQQCLASGLMERGSRTQLKDCFGNQVGCYMG